MVNFKVPGVSEAGVCVCVCVWFCSFLPSSGGSEVTHSDGSMTEFQLSPRGSADI